MTTRKLGRMLGLAVIATMFVAGSLLADIAVPRPPGPSQPRQPSASPVPRPSAAPRPPAPPRPSPVPYPTPTPDPNDTPRPTPTPTPTPTATPQPTPAPASWTSVRMESENVNINLSQAKVKVEAVFSMKNGGPKHICTTGYPLGVLEDALNDFAVTVDGKEVKDIRTIAGGDDAKAPKAAGNTQFDGPYKQWKVWDMPMEANQARTVKVTYWVKPAAAKDAGQDNLSLYRYTLLTGATWDGKIKSAQVKIVLEDVKPGDVVRRSPKGFETFAGGRTTTWKMKDFEPTEDIEIAFRASPATQPAAAPSGAEGAKK